jgi:N-acyl homoserine lactone hydrolase
MHRTLALLVLCAGANALVSFAAIAQTPPEVTLTRLDGGTPASPVDLNPRFSDTYSYAGLKMQFVYSCYLIKHGDDYMVWDTGQAMSAGAVAPKVSLVDLLGQVKVTPEQVKFVGISHYHGDHIGQANSLPKATLLIGKGDWDGLKALSRRPE